MIFIYCFLGINMVLYILFLIIFMLILFSPCFYFLYKLLKTEEDYSKNKIELIKLFCKLAKNK